MNLTTYANKLMHIKSIIPLTFLAALFAITACSQGEESKQSNDTIAANSGHTISLSKEQSALAAIETSTLAYRPVSAAINSTGEIDVPPQGIASVSAPLGGYIQESKLIPGNYVEKGTMLARLSNPDYISLQQDYLQTRSELQFAIQELERQQLLSDENATAAKKLQQSQANHESLKGRLAGLKARLQLIGINLGSLEEGNIQSSVVLRAPLSGNITRVNHHLGQFAEAREVIFEIVNQDHLHLELNVFEQDINQVQQGQAISFRPTGSQRSYSGEVYLISPKRDAGERSFNVHGHIHAEGADLKPGMFVEARILLSTDSVAALPESAIIREGAERFVLSREGEQYQLQAVETGQTMDGWVEIRNPGPLQGKQLVTTGASRLYAAMSRARE